MTKTSHRPFLVAEACEPYRVVSRHATQAQAEAAAIRRAAKACDDDTTTHEGTGHEADTWEVRDQEGEVLAVLWWSEGFAPGVRSLGEEREAFFLVGTRQAIAAHKAALRL
jgi:hypothetical protein